MSNPHRRLLTSFAAVLIIGMALSQSASPAAAQSAPSGFVNKGLVGVGRLPADMKDKFGETLGSGSGLAADMKSWIKTADGYRGIFYVLPDRGYNVEGTTDYRARLNKISVTFKPIEGAAVGSAAAEGNAVTLKVKCSQRSGHRKPSSRSAKARTTSPPMLRAPVSRSRSRLIPKPDVRTTRALKASR
jgi:hypothetical protein